MVTRLYHGFLLCHRNLFLCERTPVFILHRKLIHERSVHDLHERKQVPKIESCFPAPPWPSTTPYPLQLEIGSRMDITAMHAELMETALTAARKAGEILEDWVGKFSVSEKGPADLVTDADVASQTAIHSIIREKYDDHQILGEEGLEEGASESPFRWIIDPLDGTSNYVHQYPFYAVSIGLEFQGEMLLGVIFDPKRNEMFSGIVGEGAFLNDMPISLEASKALSESLVVASLPRATDHTNPAVARFLKVLPLAQHLQRTGSAALNLAYVASGRADAFWSTSLKPWDQAAGVAIVRAAGGVVTKIDGADFDVDAPDLLSSTNQPLQQELVEVLP